MHVCVLMVYTHPRIVMTSLVVCIFTHNHAGISTVYCRANNLAFDLVLSPLFLISLTTLPSANISSHAAVVNIADAVT